MKKHENIILKLFVIIILILNYAEYYSIENNTMDWKRIKIKFLYLAKKYKYLLKNEKIISENSPIWIMWYQGINNAPQIIKACIQSVLINRVKHPVIILDKSNIKKYIEFPEYILKKFENGIFSITHFSDIVRFALLSKYGGYWIDSTYFVDTPLNNINFSFYTLRLTQCFPTITKCLWAGNFLATPKNSFLSKYAYNAFLLYWKNYNKLIDYFLIDYIIKIAYDNIKEFRDLTEKIPFIECNILNLTNILNDIYLGQNPIKCIFNKIARRRSYQEYNNGKITNLKYIFDNYKLDLRSISNFNEILK